jgi:arylsulfatase A-like enzyme
MKNKKLIILSIAILSLFNSFCQNEQQPNFIFIITDDQSFNTIASQGNDEIITPNMDRLAKSGVTFSHAYNMGGWTSAICNPSRSMLNSGRSVWNTQKNNVKLKNKDATAIAESWGNMMNRAGYDTYMTGKWHVKAPVENMFK